MQHSTPLHYLAEDPVAWIFTGQLRSGNVDCLTCKSTDSLHLNFGFNAAAADHKVHARFEITFPDALRVVEGLIAEGADDMAATLRAISAACRAHGVTLASHDDDTVAKVALMQALGARISEFPLTIETAT